MCFIADFRSFLQTSARSFEKIHVRIQWKAQMLDMLKRLRDELHDEVWLREIWENLKKIAGSRSKQFCYQGLVILYQIGEDDMIEMKEYLVAMLETEEKKETARLRRRGQIQ